ncbi:UNVERIFIED_CONTAM: hypothetical protein Sangu_1449600 [Sesamum angustifolium]|uniref:Uncharacterized protein n=1 Tax=Sesamum angustifolium TaxID=2727405 RepID=A0AAW2N6X6_9LAMI
MTHGKQPPLKTRQHPRVKVYFDSSRNCRKEVSPEDDISTRRAWGLWVCLTEMDKVKYSFKIFSNKMNGSFMLNSMTGKNTEFAESMFEKKRMLIWENKLPAIEETRMNTCNMQYNHVCPYCEK